MLADCARQEDNQSRRRRRSYREPPASISAEESKVSAASKVALTSAHCLLIGISASLVSGCATAFKESHYYQSVNPKTNKVTNYYRLTVKGYAAMSSARYVSGYYDERAVDLYFNEVKVAESPEKDTSSQTLFSSDLKD